MDSYEDQTPSGAGSLESLRDPKGILRRRWRPMAITFLVGLVATGGATWLIQPIYRASASVLVATQKLSADFVRPTIQEDAIQRINALTSEVLSNQSLTELIEKHDLYPDLLEQKGMNETVLALREKIAIDMDRGVKFDPSESARVVLVSFTNEDAVRAADIANDIATRFTVAGIRLRSEQARVTTEFMRREAEAAETALREQSKKVGEFQEEHRGELPSELESHLRRLERLQQQRNSLALQVAETETRIAAIRVGDGAGSSSPQMRLLELKTELVRQLAVNKEQHPNVLSLRRQIAMMQKELGGLPDPSAASGARRGVVADATQRELSQLREQLSDTDRELLDLDAKVARIPGRTQELEALTQRETVLRESFLEFSRKLKDAELAQSLEHAQQGDRVSILDPAFPPSKPRLPRWMVLLAGLAGSIGLGLAVGLFLEWLDPLIVTAETLEAVAGVPVLGSLPHIAARP
jgi:uncharacterized protein involved in exopolysaccharide biosynthesis